MSFKQFGTLKYIIYETVTLDNLRGLNMGTVDSLIIRGWVQRTGNVIRVTNNGAIAFDQYKHAKPNYRTVKKDISERCKFLLHIVASKSPTLIDSKRRKAS